MTKQDYTMRIYKADKRLTRVAKYGSRNQIGWRCVGIYEFSGRTEEGMEREIRELRPLYPAPQFKFEYEPAYKTVKNLMTGKDVKIAADTPWCCNPASETYWSM
jgi:hypothetical protein